MNKEVFVLTEKNPYRLIGVYSTYSLAMNALFNNALGLQVIEVVPLPNGTTYHFKADDNDISFFIENVVMDDDFWLGPTEEQ